VSSFTHSYSRRFSTNVVYPLQRPRIRRTYYSPTIDTWSRSQTVESLITLMLSDLLPARVPRAGRTIFSTTRSMCTSSLERQCFLLLRSYITALLIHQTRPAQASRTQSAYGHLALRYTVKVNYPSLFQFIFSTSNSYTEVHDSVTEISQWCIELFWIKLLV
jgi:hypothetical protein